MPEISSGVKDYTMYKLPGATWGEMLSSRSPATYARAWPPTQSVQDHWERYYGLTDMTTQTNFLTTIFSRSLLGGELESSSSIEKMIVFRLPEQANAKIEITYKPLTEGGVNQGFFKEATFYMAGHADLNMDGERDGKDLDLFESWMSSNNLFADWDGNGIVDNSDWNSFSKNFANVSLLDEPVEEEISGDTRRGVKVTGGCTLEGERSLPAFVLMMIALLVLAIERRFRRKSVTLS